MINHVEQITASYDYAVPETLIAKQPASPRDSSRLMVYDKTTGAISCDTFAHIANYLPKNAVLVFNQTKVLPARLTVIKPTGGKVDLLYVKKASNGIRVMANKKLDIGSKLTLTNALSFTVSGQEGKYYMLKPSFPIAKMESVLESHGQTPIPPYIKQSPLKEKDLRKKYQTVFAKRRGSVAAPTASLHFTDRLLKKIAASGIDIKFVTLHVNLGTFAPLTQEHIDTGALHAEAYAIDKKTAAFLNKAKQQGRPIIGSGTTVVRTLESATQNGALKRLAGETRIFIREGYRFKFIDGMVTNFHVPQSSLLMLVAALVGKDRLFELYRLAIKHKFRLFSFGDGMLIR